MWRWRCAKRQYLPVLASWLGINISADWRSNSVALPHDDHDDLLMIWSLLLNRYVIGGIGALVVVAGIFWAGNAYGPNARAYAACQTETARRNAAVAKVNADEEARHASEEASRAAARSEFAKRAPSIGQCILTGDMAAALNGIGE